MSFRLSIRGKGTTSISKDQSKVSLGCKISSKGTLKVIPGGPAGVVGNSSLCHEFEKTKSLELQVLFAE